MLANRRLGLQSGIVVAVPIPEAHAAAGADIGNGIVLFAGSKLFRLDLDLYYTCTLYS